MKKSHCFTLIVAFVIVVVAYFTMFNSYSNPLWNANQVDPTGKSGSIALDSNGNPHISYVQSIDENPYLKYGLWNGTGYTSQTIDSADNSGTLKLDNRDQPHILYTHGEGVRYKLEYANFEKLWNTQTVDQSDKEIVSSITLDSEGNPHVAYTKSVYYGNEKTGFYKQSIEYAFFNTTHWVTQTVTSTNTSVDSAFSALSIALDSANNPQLIYTQVEKSDANSYLPYTNEITYAQYSNGIWHLQNAGINCSYISNVVIDSNSHPCFCFQQNHVLSYMYFDGQQWNTQPIANLKSDLASHALFYLDTSGNPQVYFYSSTSSASEYDGLMNAFRVGTNWYTLKLGNVAGSNTIINRNTEVLEDLTCDSQGKPVLAVDGAIGTIHGAPRMGGLTVTSGMPAITTLLIQSAITGIGIAVIVLLLIQAHREKWFKIPSKTSPR